MNPDQVDALQELMNIAMGQAADRLARLVEQQIILSIPKIHAKKGRIPDSDFSHLNDPERSAIITRQSFLGALRGEVLVCFGASGANKLAHLMGYSTDDNGDIDDASNKELVLDITNILAGACIQGLANQLGANCSFGPPNVFSECKNFKEAFPVDFFDGKKTLFMEINFTITSYSFRSDLLICVAKESLPALIEAIDKLLADF